MFIKIVSSCSSKFEAQMFQFWVVESWFPIITLGSKEMEKLIESLCWSATAEKAHHFLHF